MQRSYSSTSPNNWFFPTPNSRERVAQIASGSVIAIACLVLIGWQLHLWSLKSLIPGLGTMKANTAVCFFWTGISLLLQTRQSKGSRAAQISSLSAVIVNIIALLTICQSVFGWNLGIDELLFADPDSPATSHPGRMAINTAANFCLVGTALWLMSRWRSLSPGGSHPSPSKSQPRTKVDRIWIAQVLTLMAIAIALQALVGYTYQVRVLYQLSVLTTPMALHTAVCFAMLGGGILALTSHRGLMRIVTGDLLGSVVARRLIPTAIGIPLVLGWLILQGVRANWYDPSFALSLMAISMAGIWLGLIGQNAGKVNRLDDDRSRSADLLRSSEERLKLALLGAKQGIWEFDVQTQVLTWDDRCKEMFGLLPDALMTYRGHLDVLHPEDRQRVADAMELALRDCGEFAQEYRTIYPDGTTHWVLTQGSAYCNAGGSYRMLGTMMDVTVRKQTQLNDQFLQQLTRRLRLITDADELQDESARSIGEYLNVDRVTWFGVDWSKRLATIDRDWYRAGLDSYVGVYAFAERSLLFGDFLSPASQVALFAGESVVTADVRTDLSFGPDVEADRQQGIQASVWIPCFNENRWVATLAVNTQDVRSWREDEIALLQAVAAQIWPTIEQTRVEQALRVQAEQTRFAQVIIGQQLAEIEAIYQNAPIGLCYLDTELRYVRINERLAQINGSAVAAHLGHTLRELLPDLADDVEPIYRQVIETGEPIVDLEMSGTNSAQPGVLRTWISSFYPQTDAEHRVIGVNTVVQEVTEQQAALRERQQTEDALRVSERKFSAIFNQTFGLIGLLDVNGIVIEVNQAALDSLVQPTPWRIYARASDIIGTELWQTPWWKYFPSLQQQLREAIERAKGGEFIRYEVEFPYQLGTSQPTIDFSIKPVFDPQGEVATLIVEGRDITERVQAQIALEQRTQELDRAAAVLHDRNQELDSFVYVVSHDLKAPLRAISNLSHWIEEDLEGVLSTQIQQHTVLLRNRIQRMETTIDGLLDYARIGRSIGKIEPVAIADLLIEAIDSIASPPTFKIIIDPDLPTLQTNRLFLSQVFTNLIGNGIKHHDRADGSIVISCQECGDFYQFEITDDGPGIDPEQHERVFEIFKALNPQNRSDSTGIGLAIVKKIIEAEGGTIRLNSQLGEGTTFSFTWPKRQALAVDSQSAK